MALAGGLCKCAAHGALPHCPWWTRDGCAGPHPYRRLWLKLCRAREAHGDFTATSSDLGKGQRCLFSWELSWRSRRCFQWRPTCIMLRTHRNHGFELQHWWLSFMQIMEKQPMSIDGVHSRLRIPAPHRHTLQVAQGWPGHAGGPSQEVALYPISRALWLPPPK